LTDYCRPWYRFLEEEEVVSCFKALEAHRDKDFVDYVLLSLLTGARRDNILSMPRAS